jgi:hypothetical protein
VETERIKGSSPWCLWWWLYQPLTICVTQSELVSIRSDFFLSNTDGQ